jgi:hypothetical protein
MQGCIYLNILTLGGGISAKSFGGKFEKEEQKKRKYERQKIKENLKLKG